MKTLKYFLFTSFISLVFACDNNTEISDSNVKKTDTLTTNVDTLTGYSEGFKSLVKSEKGTFREINLGMPATEIKKAEEASQLDEEGTSYLDYMIKFADLESAEVKYILDKEGNLSSIEANIYPKSKGSQDSLYTQFDKFFTSKYGSSILMGANSLKWESPKEDLFILMEKKDTQKIHDINITFRYLTRQTASFKQ